MNTAVTVPETPAQIFRAKASSLMTDAASMTLHQLVDEFVRLSEVVESNSKEVEDSYRKELTDVGKVAFRERQVINAAARACFGVGFNTFDRDDNDDSPF